MRFGQELLELLEGHTRLLQQESLTLRQVQSVAHTEMTTMSAVSFMGLELGVSTVDFPFNQFTMICLGATRMEDGLFGSCAITTEVMIRRVDFLVYKITRYEESQLSQDPAGEYHVVNGIAPITLQPHVVEDLGSFRQLALVTETRSLDNINGNTVTMRELGGAGLASVYGHCMVQRVWLSVATVGIVVTNSEGRLQTPHHGHGWMLQWHLRGFVQASFYFDLKQRVTLKYYENGPHDKKMAMDATSNMRTELGGSTIVFSSTQFMMDCVGATKYRGSQLDLATVLIPMDSFCSWRLQWHSLMQRGSDQASLEIVLKLNVTYYYYENGPSPGMAVIRIGHSGYRGSPAISLASLSFIRFKNVKAVVLDKSV